jgi:hypothetical protein
MRRLSGILVALVGLCAATVSAQAQDSDDRYGRQLELWHILKGPLQRPDGERYFESNVKDAFLPGGVNDVLFFIGTVLSGKPANHPTQLVLALSDTHTPEVTLHFLDRLHRPAAFRKALRPGTKVAFGGVAKEFTKGPFMLTFDVQLGRPRYGGFSVLDSNLSCLNQAVCQDVGH